MKAGNRKWRTKNARRLLQRIRRAPVSEKAEMLESADPVTQKRMLRLVCRRADRAMGKVRSESALPDFVKPRIPLEGLGRGLSITPSRSPNKNAGRSRFWDPRGWFRT